MEGDKIINDIIARGLRASKKVVDEACIELDNVMPSIFEKQHFFEHLGFSRGKEDNWDIEEKAEKLGFKNSASLVYLTHIDLKVEITEAYVKVVQIRGIDVSDKEIYL